MGQIEVRYTSLAALLLLLHPVSLGLSSCLCFIVLLFLLVDGHSQFFLLKLAQVLSFVFQFFEGKSEFLDTSSLLLLSFLLSDLLNILLLLATASVLVDLIHLDPLHFGRKPAYLRIYPDLSCLLGFSRGYSSVSAYRIR